MEPIKSSRLIKVRGPKLSAWQKHLLERADDDRQWGGSANLRPRQQDQMSRDLFRTVFLFNIPFSVVGLGLIGLALAWVWFSDSGNPLQSILQPGFAFPFASDILGSAVLISFISTTFFRRAWNKRALILSLED